MIITSSHPISVNGTEGTSFDVEPPLSITRVAPFRPIVRLTNDHRVSVTSKLEDAQEHRIPSGATVIIALRNRTLKVREREVRRTIRARLAIPRRSNP